MADGSVAGFTQDRFAVVKPEQPAPMMQILSASVLKSGAARA